MARKKIEKILVIPDQHFNINCKRAWKLLLLVAKTFKPDIVIILGDMLDLKGVSKYSKDPQTTARVNSEIQRGKKALDELAQHCNPKRKVFIEGNHEERLNTYKNDRAGAISDLIDPIDKLLNLKEKGWEFVRYKRSIRIGKCRYSHFFGHHGETALKKAMEDNQGLSAVFGHTHRLASISKRSNDGRVAQVVTCGWGGNHKHTDYKHQIKTKDYVQGCVLGYMFNNGTVQFSTVPFQRGSCVIEGKLVTLNGGKK